MSASFQNEVLLSQHPNALQWIFLLVIRHDIALIDMMNRSVDFLEISAGLFMSNSQTYKLPDFLKSQTIFLIDFRDLSLFKLPDSLLGEKINGYIYHSKVDCQHEEDECNCC